MFNLKNKKLITVTSFILALVLTAGVAYAALTGVLTVEGNVNLDGNLALTWEYIGQVEPDGPGGVVSVDGQTLTINDFDLNQPGDYVEFDLLILNDGSVDAIITGITYTATAPLVLGGDIMDIVGDVITVEWPDFENYVTLVVMWDPADEYANVNVGKDTTFSISLEYNGYLAP